MTVVDRPDNGQDEGRGKAADTCGEVAAALLDPQRCRAPQEALASALRHSNELGWDRGYVYALASARPGVGEQQREQVLAELARHRETSDIVPGSGLRVGCRCGWTGACYLHGYGDPAAHREWDLHQADALLALLFPHTGEEAR